VTVRQEEKRGRRWLWSGLILLAVSAWPLFLQVREWWFDAQREKQYDMSSIYSPRATIGAHLVELSDSAGTPAGAGTVVMAPVRVTVDGRDYSSPAPVPIQTREEPENRYPGLQLVRLTDKLAKRTFLVVDQFVGETGDPKQWAWRLLFIGADGGIREERFSYAERARPLYRPILASITGPRQVGHFSEVNTIWPSPLFPLLYPWLTTLLGLCFMTIALFRRLLTR